VDHVGLREGVGGGVAAQADAVIAAAVESLARKALRAVEGVDLAVLSERGLHMTFEQDDSHAIWEGPNATGQNQPLDPSSRASPPDQQEFLAPPVETDPEEEAKDTSSLSLRKVGNFARRFSPVLVPLPFAILIFLFSLPFVSRAQILPLAVLLLALAVMQGTLLYYAGSNDTYWILWLVIGYAFFVVVGTMFIFGLAAGLILLIVLLFIGIFMARRSISSVPEGTVEIVLMSGRYARTLYPGPNLKMPWEKVSSRLSTKEKNWTCPEQIVKISRDQDVKLVATISYQLMPEDAHLAALNVDNWEESLHKQFVGTLQSVINELTPADIVNWPQGAHAQTSLDIGSIDAATITRWDRINELLAHRIQDKVAKWGVKINFVRIQDITLIPHLVSTGNPPAAMTAQPVDSGIARGANQIPAQPLQAQVMAKTIENQQGPIPQQAEQAPVASAAPGAINIDTLIDAYEAVRAGIVKDPKTIRDIAMRFDAIANDPSIHIDAGRAAQNLRQRAMMYERKIEGKGPTNIAPDAVTQPDTKEYHGPSNDYRWSGG
jgi:regulator of protease activity HflC (stomatin/prohibitin superfamily)